MQHDSTPTPDVILRSSDKTLFYSWKVILSISSPVFNSIFTLPQQNAHLADDGRPIIDLSEDKRTIERIILLCHPPSYSGKKFQIDTFEELCNLLEAATKYDMEKLRLVAPGELTTNSTFLRLDPVRVYVLACQYGQREVAQLAAKHTLALPTLLAHGYVPESEKIHGGLLCRLILYREECVAAVHALTEDHTWIVYTGSVLPLFGCDDASVGWTRIRHVPSKKYRMGREELMLVHTWWMDYMRKSAWVLQRSPNGDAVKDSTLVDEVLAEILSSKCKEPQVLQEAFKSFVNSFAREVDNRVAKVEINVGF